MDHIGRSSLLPGTRQTIGANFLVRLRGMVGMVAAVLLHGLLLANVFTRPAEHQATGSRTAIAVQLLRPESIPMPAPPSTEPVGTLPPHPVQQPAVAGSHGAVPRRRSTPTEQDLLSGKTDISDSAVTFLPASMLDRRPLPVSEPDTSMLNGSTSTGLPINLRLFIDSYGNVLRIDVLSANADDAQFIEQLKQMFFATRYIPGRRNGRDVGAFTDIQLNAVTLPNNASSDAQNLH